MYAYVADKTADQAKPVVMRVDETDLADYLLVQNDGARFAPLDEEHYLDARKRGETNGTAFRYDVSDFHSWWDGLAADTKTLWTEGAPEGTFVDNGDQEADVICSMNDGEPVGDELNEPSDDDAENDSEEEDAEDEADVDGDHTDTETGSDESSEDSEEEAE